VNDARGLPSVREYVRVTVDGRVTQVKRIGLVVHPQREIDAARRIVADWAAAHGAEVVQIPIAGQDRVVADAGRADSADLVVALGGDGTTLAALHAASAVGRPVLGAALGSLGALTTVMADELLEALDGVAAGTWKARRLPALAISSDDGEPLVAINDLVAVRRSASQVIVSIHLDGELYVRYAGDGLIVATPLGSSAYTLAAGGPVLGPGHVGYVLTPLAPHGGCCPPLVVGSTSRVTIDLAGYFGARIEIDGLALDAQPRKLSVSWVPDYATLVGLGDDESLLAGLRRRRILSDSPRVLAQDERAAAQAGGS
jgi:NAD+ kinase